MMPQRRRMLMAAAQNKRFWLYKDGVTAEGYSFGSAGYYGASAHSVSGSSSYGFSDANGQLCCSAYDGSETYAYGCAMAETGGLTRQLLSEYKALHISALSEGYAPGIDYQHVGLYSSSNILSSNGVVLLTPASSEYGELSIDLEALLNDNPDTEVFYLGAGVLTKTSMSPGKASVCINKIWLE